MNAKIAPFIPNVNDFFVVSRKPLPNGMQDNSYSSDIFRCVAADPLVLVGVAVNKSYDSGRKVIFRLDHYVMFPVAQSVVDAVRI